jgi:hypothetical protein
MMDDRRRFQVCHDTPMWKHDKNCGWLTSKLVCGCHVIFQHKEQLDTRYVYGIGGKVIQDLHDGSDLL